jgi:hypothetical protein
MDPDTQSGIAGLLGVMIPLLALSIGGLVVLSRTRIGVAIARRIGGDSEQPEFEARLVALQDDVEGLRSQPAETQERLDFAERLLTRAEESRGGPGSGA